MAIDAELKKRILSLVREDEEFRYALAGLLGLDTILSELKKLREDFLAFVKEQGRRWEEQEKRWEENNKRWEENWRRWEENSKRWEENDRRWEENWKRWEENSKRWEENERKWEEAFKRFEAIERKLLEHDKRFARLELEVGALTEATLAKFIYDDIEKLVREAGERIVSRKRGVRVDGKEVDMVVETDKSVYVIEIKTKPRQRHIDELLKNAEATQKIFRKPIKPMLAGVYIGSEVESYAKSKGVEVYKY